ncbi:NAD(P)-binding domain-containing protein, partial [Mesorhizobium sp. M0293]|uniref:NAD(P)-binding domain-containing protein n=1 Tax=Mesorhizobium sp. M0293 TaxID=2956930 RepID=UPI003335B8CA
MTIRLVLAGCGNMGYAMLSGWLKSGKLAPSAVFVVEPNADLRNRAATLGCATSADADGIPADAVPDLVVIAVKPQVIRDVTAAYKRFGDGRTTFVSIAAGTPAATFEDILGSRAPIVRCMPNTPAAIGKGMMVVFSNRLVSDDTKRFVAAHGAGRRRVGPHQEARREEAGGGGGGGGARGEAAGGRG